MRALLIDKNGFRKEIVIDGKPSFIKLALSGNHKFRMLTEDDILNFKEECNSKEFLFKREIHSDLAEYIEK